MDTEKQHTKAFKPEIGRGCFFCNCGSECEAKLCDGCFKLHETAWLEEYPENLPTDIVEVRFKNTRRAFYQNVNNLPLKRGDIVAVEASPGHDIGIVSLTGDLVARQMRRTGFNPFNGEFKKIYRKAKPYDIEKWQEAIELEHETMIASRQIAADMGLNMKIGDVEYQGDKIKAIFYYIADERVDFRELIKVFAERFHIRIEMKQIGARQEAGRIGGLGACGRELCCASWMSSFSSVTTGAARVQEISLNPQKLAGQCSKLKCCMMYEYDTYVDARKEFPRLREPLQAMDGEYYLVKNDILAGTMTFSSSKDAMVNVTTLSIARVREIVSLNRAGKKVDRLYSIPGKVPNPVNMPTVRRRTVSPVSIRPSAAASGAAAKGAGRTDRIRRKRDSRLQAGRNSPISRAGSRNAARGATTVPAMAKAAAVRGATTKAATEIRNAATTANAVTERTAKTATPTTEAAEATPAAKTGPAKAATPATATTTKPATAIRTTATPPNAAKATAAVGTTTATAAVRTTTVRAAKAAKTAITAATETTAATAQTNNGATDGR